MSDAVRDAARAVGIGVAVGFANTIVVGSRVASRLESSENNPAAQVVAMPAGLLAGACLGLVAFVLRGAPRWLRGIVLIEAALAVVYGLADHYGMTRYAALGWVPTVIAALVLEHLTRKRVESIVPPARAR